ncbi:MAG: sigma 54-interacting transcriptional regulator [Nitrospira sp.]|nr:sigma 54-interacting transcriptional regulator [Nitrospira sp.]
MFLDEIEDISPAVQNESPACLAGAEVTRLGESKPRKVDAPGGGHAP